MSANEPDGQKGDMKRARKLAAKPLSGKQKTRR
jgi:hypothetical protein